MLRNKGTQPAGEGVQVEETRHEHDLVDCHAQKPPDEFDGGSLREISSSVKIVLSRCVCQIHYLLVFVSALESSRQASRDRPETMRRNIGAPGHGVAHQ